MPFLLVAKRSGSLSIARCDQPRIQRSISVGWAMFVGLVLAGHSEKQEVQNVVKFGVRETLP